MSTVMAADYASELFGVAYLLRYACLVCAADNNVMHFFGGGVIQ